VRGLRVSLAAALSLVFACGELAATPQQVTEQFWEALRAGEVEAAKAHASASSAPLVDDLRTQRQIEAVLLGEALLGERAAIVRTSLATSLGGRRLHTSFDTHLVREAEAWRVDVEATRRALTSALFASSLQQIGEVVGEGVQAFGEALEEGTAEINRAVREALQGLERELQQPDPPY
jgi:hypothetical protein